MKEMFAIACKTDKNFPVGYWSPPKAIIDSLPYHFDTKVEAEVEMQEANRIFKKRGYLMTLEVVKRILPD